MVIGGPDSTRCFEHTSTHTVSMDGQMYNDEAIFRDSNRVHVSSLHASTDARGYKGPSDFSIRIPRGVESTRAIKLTNVEIPNTSFVVSRKNNMVHFNEYVNLEAIRRPGADELTLSGLGDVAMLSCEICPGKYTSETFAVALQNAMNFGAASSNTYSVLVSPIDGRLCIRGVHPNTPSDKYNFSVRPAAIPEQPPTVYTAVMNPYDYDPRTSDTSASQSVKQPCHCSPYRLVTRLSENHNLIPGDAVDITSAQNIQGTWVVVFVNGTEVHALCNTSVNARTVLTDCRIRIVSSRDLSRCASLGVDPRTYRSGLLVCASVRDSSNNVLSKTIVRANAATNYMNFQDTSPVANPFEGGGTHAIATVHSCTLGTTGFEKQSYTSPTSHSVVQIHAPHHLSNGTSVFVVDHLVSGHSANHGNIGGGDGSLVVETNTSNVPLVRFTQLSSQDGTMLFETIASRLSQATGGTYGTSTLYAADRLDMSNQGRVLFLYLEAVGFGPLGNIWVGKYNRPYFARIQLDVAKDKIDMNPDSNIIGSHHFRYPTSCSEFIVQLYDEEEILLDTQGVHLSFLLDFVS